MSAQCNVDIARMSYIVTTDGSDSVTHISSYHISSYLITSYHISSHHISSYHISSHLISSHHISSYRISSHLITSYLIVSYLIISYLIISHRIISHHISSYLITSHHISSHHISSYHISSHLIISHHIVSHHISSYLITSYLITSHHISSHLIISHHITSYPITSHHGTPHCSNTSLSMLTHPHTYTIPTYVCTYTRTYVQDDILYSRSRTSGIVTERYNIDGTTFEMYDVGGQRNERRKWIHCFEGISVIMLKLLCAIVFLHWYEIAFVLCRVLNAIYFCTSVQYPLRIAIVVIVPSKHEIRLSFSLFLTSKWLLSLLYFINPTSPHFPYFSSYFSLSNFQFTQSTLAIYLCLFTLHITPSLSSFLPLTHQSIHSLHCTILYCTSLHSECINITPIHQPLTHPLSHSLTESLTHSPIHSPNNIHTTQECQR